MQYKVPKTLIIYVVSLVGDRYWVKSDEIIRSWGIFLSFCYTAQYVTYKLTAERVIALPRSVTQIVVLSFGGVDPQAIQGVT